MSTRFQSSGTLPCSIPSDKKTFLGLWGCFCFFLLLGEVVGLPCSGITGLGATGTVVSSSCSAFLQTEQRSNSISISNPYHILPISRKPEKPESESQYFCTQRNLMEVLVGKAICLSGTEAQFPNVPLSASVKLWLYFVSIFVTQSYLKGS